tara:strand:+ start:663 stop:1217 length:555 start_codon:yes stop_codon:yes gene_type:complete
MGELGSINDIGCNHGQLYKELKREKLSDTWDYLGFDYDEYYLACAKEHFEHDVHRFKRLDIEKEVPRKAEATICSATFEHLDNPKQALRNMILSTRRYLILRTFVGETDLFEEAKKSMGVDQEYNINQFGLFSLTERFLSNGFSLKCLPDHATNMSEVKEVLEGSGIKRKMVVLLAERMKTSKL